MIYCPECGSEVAPNDAFCPYCGISIATNPAHLPEEISHIENASALEPESPVINPTQDDEIVDAIPPSPLALDENFQPPVAHLEEMKEPFAEEIPAELPQVSGSPEKSDLNLEMTESTSTPFNDVVFPPLDTPVEAVEVPVNTSAEPEPVNLELIDTKEKVEVPSPVLEESPVEVSTQSSEVSENSEPDLSEKVAETPVFTPTNEVTEVDEFSATLPYVAADFANNKFDLGAIPINQPEAKPLEEESQPVEENLVSEPEEVVPPFTPSPVMEASVAEETPTQFEEPSVEDKVKPIFESEPVIEEDAEAAPVVEDSIKLEAAPVVAESLVDETPIKAPFGAVVSEVPKIEEPVNPEVPQPVSKLIIDEGSAQPIPALVPEAAASPFVEQVSNDNQTGRAFTNPNIGLGVDTDGRNKTKLKPLDEGTVLYGRYEIERKIGGGGMGAVYLAKDNNLGGVRRAVKEMVQSYIEETQQDKAISDFKRESMLLTSLDHPAIPTIFDYFFDEKEGRFYLVMKYISGGDLAGRLRAAPEGRIDEVTVTDWAIQIADVLDYLHKHEPPIIYRDFKPSNIMIDGNTGKIMMIDFGIARTVHKEEKGVTAVGTMGYAPPELFSGNVEPSSDIYSLGSTLFHLLTGADPQSNPLLIFDFNKNPRPRQINPQLSDQIEQILMRSVEYSSAQRFVSAAEMRDTLSKHMENLRKGSVTFGVMAPNSGMQSASSIAVFCGFCGQKIVATDMFCPFCGAQQPLAGQGSQNLQAAPPVFAATKLTARLLLVGTNELEQTEYSLEKDNNLLGRRDPMSNIFPEVDLSKYDPQTKISRKHARIWRENDLFMLEDLGSSNGTILMKATNESNRLLPRQPHVLTNGDKIRVGDTTLRFMIG